jgi:hypothetical protein
MRCIATSLFVAISALVLFQRSPKLGILQSTSAG